MKRNYIFVFLMFFSSSFIIAQDTVLTALNEKEIEKHAQLIEQELWRNTWHKRTAILMGLCAATGGAYYFLKGPSIPVIPLLGATGAVTASSEQLPTKIPLQDVPNNEINVGKIDAKISNMNAKLDQMQELIQKDASLKKAILEFFEAQKRKEDMGFTGTVKNWGKTMFNYVVRESAVAIAFSAVMGAFGKYFRLLDSKIDSALYTVFHPGDLQWYIATHTTIYNLFSDLEWHASCIENKKLPKKIASDGTVQAEVVLHEDQISYHIQALATTWALCARELESILGFMRHKTQHIEKQVKDVVLINRYSQISEHVYQLAENFRLKTNELLQKNARKCAGLVQAVSNLRLLFSEERSAFSNCENT